MTVELSSSAALSRKYRLAHKALIGVLVLVTLYAVGMVIAGETLCIPLFDTLRFGPNSRGLDANGIQYAIFAFGVLGAVLIGWMVLLAAVTDFAISDDSGVRAKARSSMSLSVGVWFFWDTSFSLARGEYEHAAFNLPFVALLMCPLYVMMVNDVPNDKKQQ